MSGRSLAARCWQLHRAAEAGDVAARQRLERLASAGPRAGQCAIDLLMGWHRHAGSEDPCEESCAEALDGASWAAAWELYWPPGKHPGADYHQRALRSPSATVSYAVGMSNADAVRRADVARSASRARWVEREGNPVLTRSVQTVVTRADELSDAQRAAIEAAISEAEDGEMDV